MLKEGETRKSLVEQAVKCMRDVGVTTVHLNVLNALKHHGGDITGFSPKDAIVVQDDIGTVAAGDTQALVCAADAADAVVSSGTG